MSDDKAVAILTTFQDLPRTYGLVPVVLNQIRTLVSRGYEVGFYTQDGFQNHIDAGDVPQGCELIPRVPFMHLYDYGSSGKEQKHKVSGKGKREGGKVKTNLKKQIKLLVDELEPWLSEYKIVITHDIMFQSWFIPHNAAVREIGKRHPNIKWVHWLHSGPSPPPKNVKYPNTLRYKGMPNSVFVSPNDSMRLKFAEMYDVPIRDIKTVYHTFDPFHFFDMQDLTKKMVEKYDLLNADGMVVWPTRVDHPEGKGMYHAIHLVAMMNRFKDIKFVFLNSWSGNQRAKDNIERLRNEAREWGLPKNNLIFSSEMGKQWENGVPREVVRDMFILGDMFIQPSQTETFSLIMLEAAATKNMLIMNEDLTVFTELCDDRVDYIQTGSEWGGEKVTRHYWGEGGPESGIEDPKLFWREKSVQLLARLGYVDYHCEHCNKPLAKIGAYNPLRQHRHILKYYNSDWVWENQLRPILEDEW